MRFVAAESLLLSGLLLLGVYVLWDTGFILEVGAPSWVERADSLMLLFIPWQPVLAVSLGLTTYWTLQALDRGAIAFWLMALAATLPLACQRGRTTASDGKSYWICRLVWRVTAPYMGT